MLLCTQTKMASVFISWLLWFIGLANLIIIDRCCLNVLVKQKLKNDKNAHNTQATKRKKTERRQPNANVSKGPHHLTLRHCR